MDQTKLIDAQERLRDIEAQLNECDDRYYNAGVSTLSDSEYDALKEEFLKLGGVRKKVGAPVDKKNTAKLSRPMLSLAKVHSLAELLDWWKKIGYPRLRVDGKLDGASAELIYEQGRFKSAATRGDGTVGQNITGACYNLESIPKDLGVDFTGAVRGELVIARADLEALNAERALRKEKLYANCRNTAASVIQAGDTLRAAKCKVTFVPYQVLSKEQGDKILRDEDLFRLGVFPTTSITATLSAGFDESYATTEEGRSALSNMIDGLREYVEVSRYDLDGAVFKVVNHSEREQLGATSDHPNWAVALKFPPPTAVTRLESIELTVGRTGVVTPNARLTPVRLSGTTVSNASLCNAEEVARLDVYPGELVVIQKSGEIIPKVIRRGQEATHGREMWSMPATYTDSEGRVHRIVKTEGLVAHRLEFPQMCIDVRHAQMEHALGPDCLDWDGGGEVLARKLVDHCTDLSELFALPADKILSGAALARFNYAREEVKTQPLWRFIHALAPDGVGRTKSKELAQAAGGTVEGLRVLAEEKVKTILGKALYANWPEHAPKMFAQLDRLIGFGCLKGQEAAGPTPLAGLTFCITGVLTVSRPELAARIERLGGLCKDSVTKKTDYVIVGLSPGNTKLADAEKKNKPMISEDQFEEIVKKLSATPNA